MTRLLSRCATGQSRSGNQQSARQSITFHPTSEFYSQLTTHNCGEYMGKGDKKTKRGKINRASYGKNRKRKPAKKAKPVARAA